MEVRKVLLTGGCGLVGRTLAPMLREFYEVTHFELRDPADGLPFLQGDLRNSEDVARACRGMDAVVHIGALHGKAWNEAGDNVGFDVNVTGTRNILDNAARAGVKRVVFTSSIWASGHGTPAPAYLPIDERMVREPAELYGLTKALGEQMCRYATATYGLSTIVLRPGGIRPADAYSPVSSGFLTACVDVRDVAQAHVLALEAPDAMAHELFIITADSPLCRVDPGAVKADRIRLPRWRASCPAQAHWFATALLPCPQTPNGTPLPRQNACSDTGLSIISAWIDRTRHVSRSSATR